MPNVRRLDVSRCNAHIAHVWACSPPRVRERAQIHHLRIAYTARVVERRTTRQLDCGASGSTSQTGGETMTPIKKPQEPKPLGVFYPIARDSHHKEKPTGDTLALQCYLGGITSSTRWSNSSKTCKSSTKTAAYSSGEIIDSNNKNSVSVGMVPHHLRSPVNRLRSISIMAACASVGADLKRANAVSRNSRSLSLVVLTTSWGLSIHPCGSFKRLSICRAMAWPMFFRLCLTWDKYRSDNSTRSAKSLSIPLLGKCEFISRNWRNKVVKFRNLISVVSIYGTQSSRRPNDGEKFPLVKSDSRTCYLFGGIMCDLVGSI